MDFNLPLTRATSFSTADGIVIYSSTNLGWYFLPSSLLIDYLNDNLTFPGGVVTQYSSPSATAFSVSITSDDSDRHLILTPLAGYADGTIVLPLAATCRDGQTLLVNCTQAVTNLAITLNGAAGAVGAPTTLAANAFFTLKYDSPSTNWYRVG